jgi:cytochrome c biogenesis protein CcdA
MVGIELALLAGLLSTLSPCVLPLVPIVIGTALGEHRFGPMALAAGLALSFVTIGLFVAAIGFAAGLDQDVFRSIGAVLLILIGGALVLPRLQLQLAAAVGPIGKWVYGHAGSVSTRGLLGQFSVGLVLGAVWSPCVGPTLGAASILTRRKSSRCRADHGCVWHRRGAAASSDWNDVACGAVALAQPHARGR